MHVQIQEQTRRNEVRGTMLYEEGLAKYISLGVSPCEQQHAQGRITRQSGLEMESSEMQKPGQLSVA